jgi:hypothetical protein
MDKEEKWKKRRNVRGVETEDEKNCKRRRNGREEEM